MKELDITINGEKFKAKEKKFSTGKEGYGLYDKIVIGEDRFQISLNIIKIKKE